MGSEGGERRFVRWWEVGPAFGALGRGSERRENWEGRGVRAAGVRGPSVLRVRTWKDKLGLCEYFGRTGIPDSRKRIEGINVSAELTIHQEIPRQNVRANDLCWS